MSDNIIPVPFPTESDTPQVKTTEVPESIKELLENPIKTYVAAAAAKIFTSIT